MFIFITFLYYYFRIFNLYYTVVAEEKTRSSQTTSNFSLFFRSGSTTHSPAADKLNDLARQVTGSNVSKTSVCNSSRMNNLSYLVGTGIRQQRPTSYLQSASLKNLESVTVGSYKSFLVNCFFFVRFRTIIKIKH